ERRPAPGRSDRADQGGVRLGRGPDAPGGLGVRAGPRRGLAALPRLAGQLRGRSVRDGALPGPAPGRLVGHPAPAPPAAAAAGAPAAPPPPPPPARGGRAPAPPPPAARPQPDRPSP